MSPPPQPVSSIGDIKERCSKVFTLPEFQFIGWVGVFGSFSNGNQTTKSDVDLLVGFKKETSYDEIYYMEDLKGPLSQATQREADIMYMCNGQSPGFITGQALLTAKTIYEVDA